MMKADYIIKNAWVFLTYRQKFEKRDVAVLGEKISLILPFIEAEEGVLEVDASGTYLIPGLLDIHMHIESSMTHPVEFDRMAVRHGTTTVVADAHEIANVFGMEGLKTFMDQETDMDIFYAIPSSVPSTSLELETSGAEIGEQETDQLLEDDRVLCLGEVMNFKSLVESGEDTNIRKLINICKKRRGRDIRLEGHCPRITGYDLNRFIETGVDADHTQQTAESVLEKTDLGMFLELQLKSLTKEVVSAVCEHGLYENVALITDDTMPDALLTGQLNRIVRAAVLAGMPAEKAIYCATLTPARRMHLDDRGILAPGKLADFVLLDNLEDFIPLAVAKKGKIVYQDKKTADKLHFPESICKSSCIKRESSFPDHFYHSVHCKRAVPSDFILRAEGVKEGKVVANVIKIQSFGTFTQRVQRELFVRNGEICWQEAGLCLAALFERYRKNGNISYGLVESALKKPGAVATTWSHDSHNLLVLGNSIEDMVSAQNRVLDLQGGYVAAWNGQVQAEACLSVAGIISKEPLEVLAQKLGEVRQGIQWLGYENYNEIMSVSTLSLPVSPELKLTDYGLMDVRTQERVPLIAKVQE